MELTTPNSIRASANGLLEHMDWMIEELTRVAREQMSPDSDLDYVRALLADMEKMKSARASVAAAVEKSAEILTHSLSSEEDHTGVNSNGLRKLRVQISEGMINQSLLTLTGARKAGRVKMGETFQITLPDGTEFTTELCGPGNKLRERSAIRKFYDQTQACDGEYVVLTETAPGHWALTKERFPHIEAL